MAVTQDAVLEKLKNVIDPELFVNIVDLGLIYEIKLIQDDATSEPAPSEPAEADNPDLHEAATQDAASADAGKTSVQIDMTMTSPACPAGPQLIAGAKQQAASLDGVGEVEVRVVLDPPWTPDRMTDDARDQLGIF